MTEEPTRPHDPASLEQRIGYAFQEPALLRAALTHPSLRLDPGGEANNQRLEFLGDAVLGLLASESLFETFPDDREGSLTQKRASLINGSHLSSVARANRLDQWLRYAPEVSRPHGTLPDAALEDAIEALFGAVFLDGGLGPARRVFHHLFDLGELPDAGDANPKGALQEWQQSHHPQSALDYRILSISGPDHARTYRAAVYLDNRELGTGEDSSKKGAEANAAKAALTTIQLTPPSLQRSQ